MEQERKKCPIELKAGDFIYVMDGNKLERKKVSQTCLDDEIGAVRVTADGGNYKFNALDAYGEGTRLSDGKPAFSSEWAARRYALKQLALRTDSLAREANLFVEAVEEYQSTGNGSGYGWFDSEIAELQEYVIACRVQLRKMAGVLGRMGEANLDEAGTEYSKLKGRLISSIKGLCGKHGSKDGEIGMNGSLTIPFGMDDDGMPYQGLNVSYVRADGLVVGLGCKGDRRTFSLETLGVDQLMELLKRAAYMGKDDKNS